MSISYDTNAQWNQKGHHLNNDCLKGITHMSFRGIVKCFLPFHYRGLTCKYTPQKESCYNRLSKIPKGIREYFENLCFHQVGHPSINKFLDLLKLKHNNINNLTDA